MRRNINTLVPGTFKDAVFKDNHEYQLTPSGRFSGQLGFSARILLGPSISPRCADLPEVPKILRA